MNFHFPVNREHTNANNEYYRDARRLLISSGIFSALLLVGAVLVLVVFDRTPFVIGSAVVLFALAALYVGVTSRCDAQLRIRKSFTTNPRWFRP